MVKNTKCKVQKKIQYTSRRDAELNMLRIYKETGAPWRVPLGAYLCPCCYYWHLTSEYDNRTPWCRGGFHNLDEQWKNKARRKEKAKVLRLRSEWRKNNLMPAAAPKPKKLKVVILSRDKQQVAFARLHNKPANRWLRIKDWLRKLWG